VDPAVVEYKRQRNPILRALAVIGPGFVTGASDDDPSGIGTYAQAGAQFGYATLWVMTLSLPIMITAQYVSAKIGLVSGKGLSAALSLRYPPVVLYTAVFSLIVANTLNAGADIGAIAAALNLLVPVPTLVFVPFVGLATAMIQLFGSYRMVARLFTALAMALLAYLAAALFTHPDVGAMIVGTFVPTLSLDPAYVAIVVALLGTSISPYLFFWQSSQVVERQIEIGRRKLWQRKGASATELRLALFDTIGGMVFSQVVAYFIIVTFAATLFTAGQHNVGSASDAAKSLEPLAGQWSSVLLAIGLIGAGMLAVPVLTASAAYGLADALKWPAGLDRPFSKAPRFYITILAATLVGIAINFTPGLNPISALVITAVINGLLAGPLMILLMFVSDDRRIMGTRTNGRLLRVAGWASAIIMTGAAIALVVTAVFA
jgi:NRAMP (natural resistance-associated macrophage protein)-like metal ion transporter